MAEDSKGGSEASPPTPQEREGKRVADLLVTLDRAAVAMGEATNAKEVYVAVGDALRPLDLSMTALEFGPDNLLHIKHLGYDSKLILAAQRLTGLDETSYTLSPDATPFHRSVLSDRRTTFLPDSHALMRASLPGPMATLASVIVRMLGVPQMIGAPVVVDGKVLGMIVIAGNMLASTDELAVGLFARQMANALSKLALVQRLRDSVREHEETRGQLIHAQKMEALGQMAGGIAHDLNNLLQAISLANGFLESKLPGDPDVDIIHSANDRAAALVKRLLTFARPEPPTQVPVDLVALLKSVRPLLMRMLGEDRPLALDVPRTSSWTQGDANQLEQIVVNLVVNARDASKRSSPVTLTLAGDGEVWRLSVADHGCGMNEQTAARLFEPFFTTKRSGEGAGLGLAVSWGIAKAHGGTIEVDTALGVGTTMTLLLPRVAVPAPVPAAEPAVPKPQRADNNLMLLLVEDQILVRRTAERTLQHLGHRVLSAGTLAEARTLWHEDPARFDALITDIVLPDGRGTAFAAELTALRPDLPVVLVSGLIETGEPIRPEWGFLWKPYTGADLNRVLMEVVSRQAIG